MGDVVNSYNDGPSAPGQKGLGPSTKSSRFRRPRSFSRANRWSIATRQSTCRPTADAREARQEILGVELEDIREDAREIARGEEKKPVRHPHRDTENTEEGTREMQIENCKMQIEK